MLDGIPSASTVSTIASAPYPDVLSAALVGLFLEPSTSDYKLDALNALSSISRLSKVLSLFETQNFFAIYVLVVTILLYLEIGNLRFAVTTCGAIPIFGMTLDKGAASIHHWQAYPC